jgi:4-hydroxybenzoate polyprenyltransferase
LNLLKRPSKLRTLLVLGRVSNLPTVWSDCLAGWWLGGGAAWTALVCVSISASFLYTGGMFLNDAFDADFDQHHRRTRPIPSGAISRGQVWQWGLALGALGVGGMLWLGATAIVLTLVLCALILFYNAVHKMLPLAPVLMGACRVALYLVAAAAGARGVSGEAIWKGLALGVYVVGLSCLARKESSRGAVQYWPGLLLAAPVLLAGLVDDGPAWVEAMLFSLVLAVWSCWALSRSLARAGGNVGYTVSRLLAGIVLVDLLAVADPSLPGSAIFALCFVLALLLQRFIPAT